MSASSAPPSAAVRLDADEILAVARQATGLHDLGETDPIDSLQRLVRALNEEASLTNAAAAGKRNSLIRVLSNRLLLQDAFRRNPAIADQQIQKPIVIVGLPRSGTTKLHRMIAADPQMQKLPLWKLMFPVRALTPGPGTDVENRIAATEAFVEAIRTGNPAQYAGHPMMALEPDEEYFAMEISFLAHINTSSFYTPSYETWLDAQDFDNWYVWLRRYLQYFQHLEGTAGRPWVLKAPHHLGYLPLLMKYFPDATVVHCHRAPITAIASFCGLIGAARRASSTAYDPHEVGRYVLRIYGRRMQLYLRDRARLPRERFVDLPYERIVHDGSNAIAACYRAAGLPLDAASSTAMKAWETANEQHKHGRHRYDLAEYGLTEADVARTFDAYTRHFGDYLI